MAYGMTTGTKRIVQVLVWLFCIYGVMMEGGHVLAQGTVSGETVTTGASSVTVGIGTAATFSASCTPGIAKADDEWQVDNDPIYSWTVTSPAIANPIDATDTSVTVTYNAPGENDINVTCKVSYKFYKNDGTKATVSDTSKPVTVKIYDIGGPINGVNDIHYYCDPGHAEDFGHLAVASGQPGGTKYSWSISGNAQLVTDPAFPSPSNASYAGKDPGSTTPGDVTAKVTYTLNGVSIDSPNFPITVHAPTSFAINA